MFTAKSVQRCEGRAQHGAGPFAIAILDVDRRGIDALARYVFQRHRPVAGGAIPIADFQQIADHIMLGHFVTAILAARD